MIRLFSSALPPFLAQQFDKMAIPGEGCGFAVCFSSASKKECVACGLQGDSAVAVRYSGYEYELSETALIPLSKFKQLCDAVPIELRKTGILAAEDVLDGESYLVKWTWEKRTSCLVLGNPRLTDDMALLGFADRLDELMRIFVSDW